jgi:phospholipid/cholesterol/gamma-HCH transport system substrate-binding protein
METDNRYLIAGLFIIVLSVGVALAFIALAGSERRDDVPYRIHFAESVSGLSLGEPVKFRGVDVGDVDSISLNPDDPRVVEVGIRLRKDTPVTTETRATLKLKGITGGVFVELDAGDPGAEALLAATPRGEVAVIASEKSSLTTVMEQLPVVIEKFSALEDQMKDVLENVAALTNKVKENPSLLLRRPRKKDVERERAEAADNR